MLLNKDEIVLKYNVNSGIDEEDCKVSCFIKNEGEYNIYLFVIEIFNEEKLESIYECITTNIAFEFQTELDKLIERWNIYLIAITAFEVKADINYKIEQNTFSTRKIIYDNFNKDEKEIKEYIEDKLFNIDKKLTIEENQEIKCVNKDCLQDYIDEINKKYSLVSKENDSEIIYKKFIGEWYGQ